MANPDDALDLIATTYKEQVFSQRLLLRLLALLLPMQIALTLAVAGLLVYALVHSTGHAAMVNALNAQTQALQMQNELLRQGLGKGP
jgi:hypothetical protein